MVNGKDIDLKNTELLLQHSYYRYQKNVIIRNSGHRLHKLSMFRKNL